MATLQFIHTQIVFEVYYCKVKSLNLPWLVFLSKFLSTFSTEMRYYIVLILQTPFFSFKTKALK